MRITRTSIYSGNENAMEIPVDEEEFQRWDTLPRRARPFVQRAFPHLSADQREFLINGMTPEESAECNGR